MKNKKYDVVALGELLIDFTSTEEGLGNRFQANAGGAPCNLLAMLSALQHKTAFIGKVGGDFFGHQLKTAIEEIGIDATNVIIDRSAKTTLAFVHNEKDGERSFSFYRNPGADMLLKEEDLHAEILREAKIFHFGTLSMTHEGVRLATEKAMKIAQENGAILSFDPNIRPPLWRTIAEAKERTSFGLSNCQIAKLADNELRWFTGESELDVGVEKLRKQYQIPLILISAGKNGSIAYYKDLKVSKSAVSNIIPIDTTGAGDTFAACCLHYILQYGLMGLDALILEEMLAFANAAAGIISSRKGAMSVMPKMEEIRKLMLIEEDETSK